MRIHTLCHGYNTTNDEPDNELDHYVDILQRSNEDYDP
jgi:hypothetical protein